jgi:transcriptional regulator with XRE-family HTH domain
MTAAAPDMATVKAAAISFLKERMSETGMTQTELARKADCERSHLSEMLSGRLERFSLDRINRVLAVFGASIQVSYQLVSDNRQNAPAARASVRRAG